MNIVVYGAGNDLIDKSFITAAEEFGKKMAKNNYGLVFGGMKTGIMGAVARGVETNKDLPIISIVPEAIRIRDKEKSYDNATEYIYTETLNERKRLMVEKAEAIVVMPGGIGTFDEFFEVVDSKRIGYHNKPIVLYNVNNYYNKLREYIDYTVETNFTKTDIWETIKICETAEEVFEYIENYN